MLIYLNRNSSNLIVYYFRTAYLKENNMNEKISSKYSKIYNIKGWIQIWLFWNKEKCITTKNIINYMQNKLLRDKFLPNIVKKETVL